MSSITFVSLAVIIFLFDHINIINYINQSGIPLHTFQVAIQWKASYLVDICLNKGISSDIDRI